MHDCICRYKHSNVYLHLWPDDPYLYCSWTCIVGTYSINQTPEKIPTLQYFCLCQFFALDFQPRTQETHEYHCSQLDGPMDAHIYSVYRDCILNSDYFHICDGLARDIMHDILEGSLQYKFKEYLIQEEHFFTLFSMLPLTRRLQLFLLKWFLLMTNHSKGYM